MIRGNGRKGARSVAKLFAESAPDLMRSVLGTPAEVEAFCRVLIADRDDRECVGHRTAMGLIPQILQAVGSSETIVNALILQLGVPIDQAREAVQMVEDVPQDPHEQAREARRFLAWYEGPDGPGPEVV
jgi:hypothetical protein